MLEVLMGPRVGAWFFVCPYIPSFHLASNCFLLCLDNRLALPHVLAFRLIHCLFGQPLDLVGIHFLSCSYGEELIGRFHNAIEDDFVSIVKDSRFHISHKQTHVLLSPSLDASH